MSKTFLNKAGTATVSLLLAMSMLLGGCGGGNGKAAPPDAGKKATAPAVETTQQSQQKKAEEIDKKLSGARNTPIVQAAKKVGPSVERPYRYQQPCGGRRLGTGGEPGGRTKRPGQGAGH